MCVCVCCLCMLCVWCACVLCVCARSKVSHARSFAGHVHYQKELRLTEVNLTVGWWEVFLYWPHFLTLQPTQCPPHTRAQEPSLAWCPVTLFLFPPLSHLSPAFSHPCSLWTRIVNPICILWPSLANLIALDRHHFQSQV